MTWVLSNEHYDDLVVRREYRWEGGYPYFLLEVGVLYQTRSSNPVPVLGDVLVVRIWWKANEPMGWDDTYEWPASLLEKIWSLVLVAKSRWVLTDFQFATPTELRNGLG
jgi:hypothetical protein